MESDEFYTSRSYLDDTIHYYKDCENWKYLNFLNIIKNFILLIFIL